MRVLVCGSRTWTDAIEIRRALVDAFDENTRKGHVLIHGAARGADNLSEEIARTLQREGYGIIIEAYPADWVKQGRRAGYVRNEQMLREGKPDLVLAFWDGQSRGTRMMIELARKAGVPVRVIEG